MRLCFSESRCFGVMKNQKIKKIYGGPTKLLSFKNAGKLAFSQPNFNAATSHCTKKFMKSKLQSLEFRIKVVLFKNSVKCSRREQFKFKASLIFALELKKGIFFNEIYRPEFNMILSKKQLTLSFNCSFLPHFSELLYKITFILNCKDQHFDFNFFCAKTCSCIKIWLT